MELDAFDRTPPMTAHAFTTTFDSALNSKVIKKSIDKTSDAA